MTFKKTSSLHSVQKACTFGKLVVYPVAKAWSVGKIIEAFPILLTLYVFEIFWKFNHRWQPVQLRGGLTPQFSLIFKPA